MVFSSRTDIENRGLFQASERDRKGSRAFLTAAFFWVYGLRKVPQFLNNLRRSEWRNSGTKARKPPAVTSGFERGRMSNRYNHTTVVNPGVEWREGLAFAAIWILFVVAVWTGALVGGV